MYIHTHIYIYICGLAPSALHLELKTINSKKSQRGALVPISRPPAMPIFPRSRPCLSELLASHKCSIP